MAKKNRIASAWKNNASRLQALATQHFEAACVGLTIKDGLLTMATSELEHSADDPTLLIKHASRKFTMNSVFKIVANINEYMKHSSEGRFKVIVDGITFHCCVGLIKV